MDTKEFMRRRRQFMRMIGREAIAILPAAPVRHRNGDIEYAYRQDSHFHYLTGFPEPEAVAVLVPGRPQAEYLLFVRERDPGREAWDGPRAGTEGAVMRYGADDAFPIADIDEILPGLIEQRAQIFYSMGTHLEFDPHVLGWVNGLKTPARERAGGAGEFVALNHVLDDMRLYKSRAERSSLKRAAEIGVHAHRRAMRFARPGRMEYEVMAEVVHEFRSHNADLSYTPIVAGGANACIMHYRDNDQRLRDGDYKVGGEWRVLEPGMALTVEPGIYIRPSSRLPKEFWNIGIRIEDDVLVTNGAPEVLTGALEKTPEAVERLASAA